jgi:hypothetical protein
LDEAGIRKRAATKGDVIVDVKPGEEVVSINVGWTVEKFVGMPNGRANGHKSEGAGKKNGSVKASVNGKSKTSPPKKKTAKVKTKAKSAAKKSTSSSKAVKKRLSAAGKKKKK